MRQNVCDAPIPIVHEHQIEVVHAIIVALMEEIVSGNARPCVGETSKQSQRITLQSHGENR